MTVIDAHRVLLQTESITLRRLFTRWLLLDHKRHTLGPRNKHHDPARFSASVHAVVSQVHYLGCRFACTMDALGTIGHFNGQCTRDHIAEKWYRVLMPSRLLTRRHFDQEHRDFCRTFPRILDFLPSRISQGLQQRPYLHANSKTRLIIRSCSSCVSPPKMGSRVSRGATFSVTGHCPSLPPICSPTGER